MTYRRSTALVMTILAVMLCLAFALPSAGAQGCPNISVSPPSGTKLPNGKEGEPYNVEIGASGGTDANYFWQLTGGALPPGLDWNPKGPGGDTMTISGTPIQYGFYNPSWQVYDDGSGQCLGSPAHYNIEIDPVNADVFIQKNANPTSVTVGQPITYTLGVGNGGPATATNVTVSDPLASGVTIQSITTTRGSCNSGNLVFCNLGDIPMNEGAEITIVASVDQPGTISNTASVSSGTPDPFPSNNSASRQVEVVPSDDDSDLAVVKKGPDEKAVGRLIEYSVTVRNQGPDPADNVSLVDSWDQNLAEFESASGGCTASTGGATCGLGTIAAGGSATVTITLLGKEPGKLVNSASASSSSADPDATNNVGKANTTITGLELIGLEVTQGIQNWEQAVPLMANRTTYVRAHVRAVGGPVKGIGARLTGKLLNSSDTFSKPETTPIYPTSGTLDVVTKPDRGKLTETYLFQVPFRWTDPGNQVDIKFEATGDRPFACRDVGEDCSAVAVFTKFPIPKFRFYGVVYYSGQKLIQPSKKEFAAAEAQLEAALPFSEYKSADGGDVIDALQVLGIAGTPDDPLDYKLILKRLQVLRAWNGCFAALGCTEYYVGLLAPSSLSPPTSEGGGAAGVAFAYVTEKQKDTTLAHEIAHAAGRGHTLCPGMDRDVGAIDEAYPYQEGRISTVLVDNPAFWGLNTNLFNSALPTPLSPTKTFDLMSYCEPAWPSNYTWNALTVEFAARFGGFPALQREFQAGEPQQTFLVSGETRPDGSGSLSPVYQVEAPPSESTGGDYTIRLRDANGADLAVHAFEPDINHGEGFFVLQIPFDAAAQTIELMHGDQVLDSVERSGGAPSVQVVQPTVDNEFDLEWNASDGEGDPIYATVQYSSDGGSTWETLAVDIEGSDLAVFAEELAGSNQGAFRVVTTDGFSSTLDVTDEPVVIPFKAPDVAIVAPHDGAVLATGSTVGFRAVATDREDGSLDAGGLVWSSDEVGSLGTGGVLDVESLSPGRHVITVTATDGDGMSGSDSVSVNVYSTIPASLMCEAVAPTTVGSGGSDDLPGLDGVDVISLLGGGDRSNGGSANDRLCGGGGKDKLSGGGGADSLFGGKGDDTIDGGPGRDVCYGGPGKDRFKNCEVKKP